MTLLAALILTLGAATWLVRRPRIRPVDRALERASVVWATMPERENAPERHRSA